MSAFAGCTCTMIVCPPLPSAKALPALPLSAKALPAPAEDPDAPPYARLPMGLVMRLSEACRVGIDRSIPLARPFTKLGPYSLRWDNSPRCAGLWGKNEPIKFTRLCMVLPILPNMDMIPLMRPCIRLIPNCNICAGKPPKKLLIQFQILSTALLIPDQAFLNMPTTLFHSPCAVETTQAQAAARNALIWFQWV